MIHPDEKLKAKLIKVKTKDELLIFTRDLIEPEYYNAHNDKQKKFYALLIDKITNIKGDK